MQGPQLVIHTRVFVQQAGKVTMGLAQRNDRLLPLKLDIINGRCGP